MSASLRWRFKIQREEFIMTLFKKILAGSFAFAMAMTAMPEIVKAEETKEGVMITENVDYPDSDAEYQVTSGIRNRKARKA